MTKSNFKKTTLLKVTFVLSVIFASFLFLKQGGHSGITFQHADKIAHFLIFFSLTLLLDLSFKLSVNKILLILSAYGVTIEVLQSFLPYRSASLGDILADILGVVVYIFLLRTFFRKYLKFITTEPS
jgi:VanZ family protein